VSRNPITGIAGCWARAASGHPTVEPAIPVMKSRRRIASPGSEPAIFGLQLRPSKQKFATSDMGRKMVSLRCKNSEPRMSARGHFRQIDPLPTLSACPLLASEPSHRGPTHLDGNVEEFAPRMSPAEGERDCLAASRIGHSFVGRISVASHDTAVMVE
jgi:hypothetical protein